MAFQMGIQGLFSFKRALKAVEDGDWVDILPSLKEGDSYGAQAQRFFQVVHADAKLLRISGV